jgi:electron transport complex protein RnfD
MEMSNHLLAAAPHAHDRSGVERIMLHVCLALMPTTAFGIYLFGWPALILFSLTCASAVVTEMLCLALLKRPLRAAFDSSALLTGWLLALSLPPWAPWWIGVGGAAFAIAVGKQLYGGIGQNVFNPAMLARVALLISFPVQMTTWVTIQPLGSPGAVDFQQALGIVFGTLPMPDGTTGATLLGEMKAATAQQPVAAIIADDFSLAAAFQGLTRGSMGETSELLIALGACWLLFKRIISWHIPVAMMASLFVVSGFFYLHDGSHYPPPIVHFTSGGFLLGAFFIATDYVTSPASNGGKLIFGAGCGIMLFVLRTWSGFPEAIAFAVLFMNALTPLIDRSIKPRVYGRNRRGQALQDLPEARKVL